MENKDRSSWKGSTTDPRKSGASVVTRRTFLKAGLAGLLIGSTRGLRTTWATPGSLSSDTRVTIVDHPLAVDDNWHINASAVQEMVERAILEWSETTSPQDAWAKILPGLQDTHTIAIKVNCLNRHFPTHPPVVHAIVDSMRRSGIADHQILIWDRRNRELEQAGFRLNRNSGVQCFGTDEDGVGYDEEERAVVEGHRIKLSRILTSMCDHLINVPVLKDHNTSGVSLSLKNHYGSIPLLDDLPWSALAIPRMHAHHADPQIAHLNAAPPIRDKTRLIVCDALLGIYNGGPSGAPQWANRQILVGDDPVAVDHHGMQIIEEKRAEQKLDPITRKAGHIHTAAEMGLGTDDPQHMTRILTRIHG